MYFNPLKPWYHLWPLFHTGLWSSCPPLQEQLSQKYPWSENQFNVSFRSQRKTDYTWRVLLALASNIGFEQMGGSGTVYLPGLVGFSRKTWHKKFKVGRAKNTWITGLQEANRRTVNGQWNLYYSYHGNYTLIWGLIGREFEIQFEVHLRRQVYR